MSMTLRSYVRTLGRIEASSLLILLFICTPLKWFAGIPEPSRIVGTLHGCLFLMYIAALITNRKSLELTHKQLLLGIVFASLPGGPILFESGLQGR